MQYEIGDSRVLDLDSRVTGLEDTVRKVENQQQRQQQRFDDLGNSLDDLHEELESLQRAVEDNESTARDQTVELKEKLEELEADVGDAARTLSRLGDRMGWIERHIRASGGATEVNFDDQAGELKSLVRKVKQGQQAKAQLLDDDNRRRLTASVAQFDQQAKRIDGLTTAALQASSTLTATGYGDEKHTNAAKAFRTAFKARQSEIKLHQQQQTRVEQERTQLTQDDRLRNTHAAMVQAGEEAAQTMRMRLRTIIEKAFGESALPPVWFATPLGITPPRTGTDEWLDTATEVVAYRITYGITNRLVALGAKPDIKNSARYDWYQELLHKLDRYTN